MSGLFQPHAVEPKRGDRIERADGSLLSVVETVDRSELGYNVLSVQAVEFPGGGLGEKMHAPQPYEIYRHRDMWRVVRDMFDYPIT